MVKKKICTVLLLVGVIVVLVLIYLKYTMKQVPCFVENQIYNGTNPQSSYKEKANDISDVFVNHMDDYEQYYEENILIAQLKSGDFSSLIGDKPATADSVEKMYEHMKDELEWVEWVNKDGRKGLILQEKRPIGERTKAQRIVAIFGFINGGTKLAYIMQQMTYEEFLSNNGNIVYHHCSYGAYIIDEYSYCTFDDEWNESWPYKLILVYVYDLSELPENWDAENPEMKEVGYYYRKLTKYDEDKHEEIVMSKDRFLDEFYELTGCAFYDVKPEWYND